MSYDRPRGNRGQAGRYIMNRTHRHQSDTKTFGELTFAEQAKAINIRIVGLERSVRAHLRRATFRRVGFMSTLLSTPRSLLRPPRPVLRRELPQWYHAPSDRVERARVRELSLDGHPPDNKEAS